jgi:hypothetical protein
MDEEKVNGAEPHVEPEKSPPASAEPVKPETDTWKTVLGVLVVAFVIVVVFGGGVMVGFEKAHFSDKLDANYYPNVLGLPTPLPGKRVVMLNAHGVAGPVIRVTADSLVVGDPDGAEKTVLVSGSTPIREDSNNVSISDIKVNDQVVVIGSPNEQGEVQAMFIRVMDDTLPSPPPQQVPGK